MSYLRPNLTHSKQRPNSSRPLSSVSATHSAKFPTTINPELREKLKTLLREKYKKKFGKLFPEKEVRIELDNFMGREVLAEKDLKELDKKVEKLVMEFQNKIYLSQNLNPNNKTTINLNNNNNFGSTSEKGKVEKVVSNKKSSNLSHYSRSKQGDIGYQDNDGSVNGNLKATKNNNNYNTNGKNIKSRDKSIKDEYEEEDRISVFSNKKAVDRLEFDEKGEWNAIAEFNKQDYLDRIQKQRLKDKELKNKTKCELNEQMNQNRMRKQYDRENDLKYGEVVNKNVAILSKIEIDKVNIEKEKGLIEKKIRDEQMIDNKSRLKKEFKNQRDFEKELLSKLKKEVEKEEKEIIRKKKEKHDELIRTLKDNEINKKILQERLEKERLEDINAQIEYGKMLDKQEKERADYFKDRERKGNTFISLMVENVIKEQEMKNQKLDETLRKYQEKKDLLY